MGRLGLEIICMQITEIALRKRPMPSIMRQLVHRPSGLLG